MRLLDSAIFAALAVAIALADVPSTPPLSLLCAACAQRAYLKIARGNSVWVNDVVVSAALQCWDTCCPVARGDARYVHCSFCCVGLHASDHNTLAVCASGFATAGQVHRHMEIETMWFL